MSFESSQFPKILGMATLNEKGQLVIPVEARNSLDMQAGSKVVIMQSPHRPALIILKAEQVETMIQGLTDVLQSGEFEKMRQAIKSPDNYNRASDDKIDKDIQGVNKRVPKKD